MRRTGVPGQRFKGASPLKSPGPSPAVFNPPHAITRTARGNTTPPNAGRPVSGQGRIQAAQQSLQNQATAKAIAGQRAQDRTAAERGLGSGHFPKRKK